MKKEELQKDIKYLLENPNKTFCSKYHDASSCWYLIDELIIQLRTSEETVFNLQQDILEYELGEDL